MTKRFLSLLLLIVWVAGLAGCATVQKKFTRKKKTPKHTAATIYFQEGAYQKKFSNDYYYKTHYTFWKTWQDELITQLGGNQKKVARSAQEALGHLTEMNRYLVPEKQAELKPLLDDLARITRNIEGRGLSDSEIGSVRVELEKIKRLVANDFYYEKVKDQLLPDTIDLGTPSA